MGCSPGSKFTCILFLSFSPASPVVPASASLGTLEQLGGGASRGDGTLFF